MRDYTERALEAYEAWTAAGEPIDIGVLNAGFQHEEGVAGARRDLHEWAEMARKGQWRDRSRVIFGYLTHYVEWAARKAQDDARRTDLEAKYSEAAAMRVRYSEELRALRDALGLRDAQVDTYLRAKPGSFHNLVNPAIGNSPERLRDAVDLLRILAEVRGIDVPRAEEIEA